MPDVPWCYVDEGFKDRKNGILGWLFPKWRSPKYVLFTNKVRNVFVKEATEYFKSFFIVICIPDITKGGSVT